HHRERPADRRVAGARAAGEPARGPRAPPLAGRRRRRAARRLDARGGARAGGARERRGRPPGGGGAGPFRGRPAPAGHRLGGGGGVLVESGAMGGLAASGVYFGASLSPKRIVSSAEMFALCAERLDATCLGVLEADGEGNVNVSRRSDGVRDYVGPGGFIDLSTAAETIVFVSGWMVHGEMRLADGAIRIVRRGAPKFVERVREITFSG